MPPEGMVHAFEVISKLLKPCGCLVDIHPTPIPAELLVRAGELETLVGTVYENDNYIEYSQAEAAQASILAAMVYNLEMRNTFLFEILAADVEELLAYFADDWRSAYLTSEEKELASRLLGESDRSQLVVRESITIARMCNSNKASTGR